jgi:Cu/Zn superoxide dismutase
MSKTSRRGRRIAAAAAAGAVAVAGAAALAGGALSGRSVADAAQGGAQGGSQGGAAQAATTTAYQFTTLNNAQDVTFNQLLGINNRGTIAGYLGSGAAGHPNKGYLLFPNYGQGNYASENFPGSVQTQVTGLNDNGVTVGFWSPTNNASMQNENDAFWERGGQFHSANVPFGEISAPAEEQLLGVNDANVAVGFFTEANGLTFGYKLNINTGKFSEIVDPNAPGASLTAAAINNGGDVAGFYANPANGNTDGFLLRHGAFTDLAYPGASATQALGVNDRDEVVGTYTVGSGSGAVMHGFTWTPGGGFTSVDDPHGMGTTTVNGVNDAGELVGFYVDAAGNTDGFLATAMKVRQAKVTTQVQLAPMPQGTVTLGRSGTGSVDATVSAFGLTPGSAHTVELVNGAGGVVTTFGTLTAGANGQAQATLTSGYKFSLGSWRVVILNGTAGDPVSAEPIAQTARFDGMNTYQLNAVEVDQNGNRLGTPQGNATFTYDPAAQTISVTVNASGLTPGAHAAHIHAGTCQQQGAVQYMLMDFTANAAGQIANQTRTVTGVTTPLPANGSWYLNLHQGDSNNILANGNPTINFRPLLCGEIVTQP